MRELIGLCCCAALLVLIPAGVICFCWVAFTSGWPPPLYGYVTTAVATVAALLYGVGVRPVLAERDMWRDATRRLQ